MDKVLDTINSIRVLSAEQIEGAKSGHPGIALGAAPIAYNLFANFLKFNPKDPKWDDRDRFVLSAGHGSALYYSLLYLFGYGLTVDDLKSFRQFGSRTPGHPEYNETPGVEVSTGPLGMGIANAVGMAIAEAKLAAEFNTSDIEIVNHYTYALCGDGCMMEGISNEACSLAGTLKLGKLILFYDDNDITIEGNTDIAFKEDVAMRYTALGWQVIKVANGNDVNALKRAVKKAQAESGKPSLIVVKTTIGFGAPNQGTSEIHGSPLGAERLAALKANLGWTEEPFSVPQHVLTHTKRVASAGKRKEKVWKELFKSYEAKYPELAAKYKSWMSGKLPDLKNNEDLWKFDKPDATRNTSGAVLNKLANIIPNLIGGSADLAPSNKSNMKARESFSSENYGGSNLHFGVREHAMGAITSGIYLHGGLIPYCATFFVFSDYMKGAIRQAAIMNIPVTYIFSHDSIGVGEDGPTHEPIEQLAALRATPNVKVFRPADGKETTAAWIAALTTMGPTAIATTRQNLPQYDNTGINALKGGYILSDCEGTPDILLIASGSEVELIMKAQAVLAEKGVKARVVSMPCMDLFDKQTEKYKQSVLPINVRRRVCVEAGVADCWYKYAGLDGEIIAMHSFGVSGKYSKLFEYYGFTVDNVVAAADKVMAKKIK